MRAGRWAAQWALIAVLTAAAGDVLAGGAETSESGAAVGRSASGLPLPRFVSLKADRVNLRSGPGTDYPTSWVYRQAGLPVEVIKEFESWRQVRDSEGATGWILQSLLSGRRTALVTPWDKKPDSPVPQVPVRNSDSERARTVAIVEAGVIANIHSCDGLWCNITIDRFRGYMPQKQLWGVYPNETVK
jgi:SH3-like domain-containing protein